GEPAFPYVEVDGQRLRAGSGAALATAIAQASRHGLAGLETLVGVPGTVGGALCHNAGDRVTEMTQYVRLVEAVDGDGQLQTRRREELGLDEQIGSLAESVVVGVQLELEPDAP